MKKTFFAVAVVGAALAVAPGAASAQLSTASATVNASAFVQANLSATTTNQLRFGELQSGATSTLTSSGATQSALSTSTTAGLGQVQVTHNSKVNVTATLPTALSNGTATLSFSANCASATTSGGAGTAITNCSSFSVAPTAVGTSQSTYLLIGGTFNSAGAAATAFGTYQANITFNFAATN